ncbi:MAG: hypothetical protein HC910_16605 [Spirulinaceae cyanobacterium SM2_1_0]|nr:hypothetical protein [Spirulinaceae cyanobacterium SM2_1_0]
MLYLAEVRKQKSGFMGKATTELKLLACQRNDQTWNSVPGDETVPGDEAGDFDSGVLVVINLNNNRQVQGAPESASAQIVRDLQRFSRLQEKIKSQEEEIEVWKQSLTSQAQELAKREMELSADLEQLEQFREQGGSAALSDADLEEARREAAHLKAEFERKTQELESAWEQLRGAQAKLEEQTEAAPAPAPAAGLDPEQLARIHELIDYLQTTAPPTTALREQLTLITEALDNQQDNCNYHWQQLEEKRADAQQQQSDANEQGVGVEAQRQQLQAATLTLESSRQKLHDHQHQLELKQASINLLQAKQQQQVALQAILNPLATPGGDTGEDNGIDLEALEQMPLEALQSTVDSLQQDLDKVVQFVEQQEEELRLQRQTVEDLEEKLKNANVYETSEIEQELEEEREQKGMLDETLVGQRRTLGDRQLVLKQHLRILRRRQGIAEPEDSGSIDLTPAITALNEQIQATQTEVAQLQSEQAGLQQELNALEAAVQQQVDEHDNIQAALHELEAAWQDSRSAAALLWGRVNLYEEMLKPLQDSVEEVRQKLGAIAELLDQTDQTAEYQHEALGNLKQTVDGLTPVEA